jgi:hypothetical protein
LQTMREEFPNLEDVKRQTPAAFLRQVEARTALLIHAGHERLAGQIMPVYEFRHLSFQEYLAAWSMVHVWTAPGAQGLLRDLARGTSAVMCPAYNAADDRWPRWVSPSRPPNTDAASMSPCTKRGFLFVGSTGCHLLRLPFCSSAVTNG